MQLKREEADPFSLFRIAAFASLPTVPLPDVMRWSYTGNKLHPKQKPVDVLTKLIEAFSASVTTVLDPLQARLDV